MASNDRKFDLKKAQNILQNQYKSLEKPETSLEAAPKVMRPN